MIFFQDKKKLNIITYDDLLDKINNYNYYNNFIKEENADAFFFKLIYNLCYNIDTVILDNDVSFDFKEENVEELLIQNMNKKFSFETWNDLLEQLLKTTAKLSIFTFITSYTRACGKTISVAITSGHQP